MGFSPFNNQDVLNACLDSARVTIFSAGRRACETAFSPATNGLAKPGLQAL
jgi:hypothetical protein